MISPLSGEVNGGSEEEEVSWKREEAKSLIDRISRIAAPNYIYNNV